MTPSTARSDRRRARETNAGLSLARHTALVCVLVAGAGLSGCGVGALVEPLAASSGMVTGSVGGATMSTAAASSGISEIHSSTCPGLEIERQERLRRIAGLQSAVANELASPPATVIQAMKRVSGAPEEGTVAHGQIMEERAYLASIASAAARLGCPPAATSASGKTL
jgi:hypothetical protein